VLGIITGSGFYRLEALQDAEFFAVSTPYGQAALTRARFDGEHEVVFLARHGTGHSLAPHLIDYRSNLWALREAGVTEIVATAVSGGIRPDLTPGSFVLIDDFIDFTHGRAHTFFDEPGNLTHTDMQKPYDTALGRRILAAASRAGVAMATGAVYCATNGPRFESRSEIEMMRRVGGDLVGMTGCPEVVLANELGIPYASIGVISNRAAGLSDDDFTLEQIMAVLSEAVTPVQEILRALLGETTGR
jgi:5'-deoxy-5'-methylthioadenosine phosphorylase